jgi:2-polyprenyl-6-methoxyphenol hydroxylase-like FAD-dependent oxidoreductase
MGTPQNCCIVGGGPAGIMLGYLLARSGVQVTVLEKHLDFFRDFRGDTVHPSTLEVLHELGMLEEFLSLPHQELTNVGGRLGDYAFQVADFRNLPTTCKFIALMPQWDFLNFLSIKASQFPGFELRMGNEIVGLMEESGRITGVKVRTPAHGSFDLAASLVVACDGRHSIARSAGRLDVQEFGVPIDVLWFRISRKPGDPEQLLGNVNYGKALVLINRTDYFQAGLLIRKDSFNEIRQEGLERFRQTIIRIAPYLGDRVDEVQDWDQVKLLTVQINRLRRWYRDGLLCIGDAAHAMSPAGGVGINLAIQDAVAAARILLDPLLQGTVDAETLRKVQDRREFPTRATQFVQVNIHRLLARIFDNPGPATAPWQIRALTHVPGIQHLVGRAVGIGVRPEHVVQKRQSRPEWIRQGIALCAGAATALSVAATLIGRDLRSIRNGPNGLAGQAPSTPGGSSYKI